MADSAPATVKMYKEKIWPNKSSKNTEKKIKFKFTANNMISKDTIIKIIFLRVKIIPKNPIINKDTEKNKKSIKKNVVSIKLYILIPSKRIKYASLKHRGKAIATPH